MDAISGIGAGVGIAGIFRIIVALALGAGMTPALPYSAGLGAVATSPTIIPVGGSVSFTVSGSFTGDSTFYEAPSDPPPELPFWGTYTQTLVNTRTYTEGGGVAGLWVSGFPDDWAPPVWNGGAVWSFSYRFPSQGAYDLQFNGSFAGSTELTVYHTYLQYECYGFDCIINGPYGGGSSEFGTISGGFDPVYIRVTVVPEPEIYVIMSVGLGLVGFLTRHRIRQATA